MVMEIVTETTINPNEIYDRIKKETVGSVVLHFAVVREFTGDQVTQIIDFQRNGDIENELKAIVDSIKDKYELEDVLIIRRLGALKVGEVMSLVAASAPHREDAFDACRHGVESLKKMKTIKKAER
jgi:molybdopterin synthase catalytic subunit